jgi:hypothetical protein
MTYVTLKKYNRTHSDYKGIYEDSQSLAPHLKGNRSILGNVDGVTSLLIEGAGLEIVDSFDRDFILNNGSTALHVGSDDWCKELFKITLESSKKITAVFLEENNQFYSITGEGEPDRPLRQEYQARFI